VAERLVRAHEVVQFEVAANARSRFIEVLVGMQEDFLVVERVPGALDEDVVDAAASPLMFSACDSVSLDQCFQLNAPETTNPSRTKLIRLWLRCYGRHARLTSPSWPTTSREFTLDQKTYLASAVIALGCDSAVAIVKAWL
jgi:hypothetical protein